MSLSERPSLLEIGPLQRVEVCVPGQANNGSFSHTGASKYAFDFRLPLNTPIRAARAGIVSEVVEQNVLNDDPNDPDDPPANLVRVEHEDHTFGAYVHLIHNGADVHVGERVRRGEVIARSGNTGTTRPHLHFKSSRSNGNSIRIRFELAIQVADQSTGPFDCVIPTSGLFLKSTNVKP